MIDRLDCLLCRVLLRHLVTEGLVSHMFPNRGSRSEYWAPWEHRAWLWSDRGGSEQAGTWKEGAENTEILSSNKTIRLIEHRIAAESTRGN